MMKQLVGLGVPVNGHHWKTAAAAAAGEGIWRYFLSRQSSQHKGLSSKKVCNESHEFQQSDGVIPAQEHQFRQWRTSKLCMFVLSLTHNDAIKLQSEEERGTYRDMRDVKAKACDNNEKYGVSILEPMN